MINESSRLGHSALSLNRFAIARSAGYNGGLNAVVCITNWG